MRVLRLLFLLTLFTPIVGCGKDRTANPANRETAFGQNALVQSLTELHEIAPPDLHLGVPPTLNPTAVSALENLPVVEKDTVTAQSLLISASVEVATQESVTVLVPPVEAAAIIVPPARDQGVSNGPVEMIFVTFYYCQRTVDKPDDGGGFCGHTATGVTVHPGTAACASSELHRYFVFQDDPQYFIFRCEDTGGAVGSGHVDIWFMTNSEGYNSPLTGTRNIIWQD